MKKILFIIPLASNTGSSLQAKRFLEHLKTLENVEVDIMFLFKDGDAKPFEKLARRIYSPPPIKEKKIS